MKKVNWLVALVVMLLLAACSETTAEKESSVLWPTEEWAESTPEEQGVDSEKLVEMFEYIEENKPGDLHGLLVMRNGYIIAEKYHFPYNQTFPHNTFSVTKSLMGAIAGVAIEEGIISLDDRVLEFFPDMTFENMSEEKENMTIEQLLTMTNGIKWPEWEQGPYVFTAWEAAENQLQYYLDQPIIVDQVGEFNYDTGAAVAMAAIIEKETGMQLADYAQEKIFEKIGMTSLKWAQTKEGTTNGGTDSQMTPRDMARFGYLYLNNGNWDGKQIIPEDWVATSTKAHTGDQTQGYGYFFWLSEEYDGKKAYYAMGSDNQYILMVPEDNLIVVQTSAAYSINALLNEYILPAIESDEPLPENEEANAKLKELMAKEK